VGAVLVSATGRSFRSWKQFPQPEAVSAARNDFRSYHHSVFKFTVKMLVQNHENAGVIEHMKTWSISKTSRKKNNWLKAMSKK